VLPLDIGAIANVATALTLLVALVFGVVQVRQQARHQRELAAMSLIHSIQTPEYILAWPSVWALPDGARARDINADLRKLGDVVMIMTTLDSIAIMIERGLVPYELWREVDGGITATAWRKLERWVSGVRRTSGADTYGQLERLARRLAEDRQATGEISSESSSTRAIRRK
jgi:hypothetical protein